jgi:nucleoside-diphosphate-sugar epimerase
MEGDFLEPVNVGNPDLVAIAQLAREVLAMIPQSTSKLTFAPRPDYDPRALRPDLMRARQLFGWTPKVSRAEGLSKLIEDFRQRGIK